MNAHSHILRCDDADPESRCTYSVEGTSVDEVYQSFMKHVQASHSEKIKTMTPEQLKNFDNHLHELLRD